MIAKKLRAIAVALVLGTAAAATVGAFVITPAEAAVRSVVGKPLQAALVAAQAGKYDQAMSLVKQAEAVGGLTAEEQKVVSQMREYIEVKSGGKSGVSDATGAKAKFAADWGARRYRDVIDDGDMLRKYGAMDEQSAEVIAQAYYLMSDFHGCIRTADDNNSPGMLTLRLRCAYELHDGPTMRAALEQLVSATGQAQYWNQLLRLAQNAKSLTDHETLDIYRIKFMTGSMTGADDYFTLAQLDIQFGLADEAVAVVQKGMTSKVLVDGRAQRLLDLAKKNAAAEAAGLGNQVHEAQTAKSGDDLVKLGEAYCGMNRYKDAVDAIQAGIKKGVTDKDNAQIRLGQALYGMGQKDAALKAFTKTTSDNGQMVAHLWSLYVKTH